MAVRKLGQTVFDLGTGEDLSGDGFVAYVVPKRRNGFSHGRFLAMSQDAMVNLSRSAMQELAMKRLGLQEYAVFLCLVGHVDYENHILLPQAEMAAKIGMNRSHFSRSLKRLIEHGIVEKGPKIGRMVSLKMNPEIAWKGSGKNHVAELSERRRRMNAAGISGVIEGGKPHQSEVSVPPIRDEHTLDLFPELLEGGTT